jgi:hypothetical protein
VVGKQFVAAGYHEPLGLKMKNELLIFIAFFIVSCGGPSKIQYDQQFHFNNQVGQQKVLTIDELDKVARPFIAAEWNVPVSEVSKWLVKKAEYNEYHDGVLLYYDRRKIAPETAVLFDSYGNPEKVLYFK